MSHLPKFENCRVIKFIPPNGWTAPPLKIRYEDSTNPKIQQQIQRLKALFAGGTETHYLQWVSDTILDALYGPAPWAVPSDVKSITWILREFDGLAYVCGGEDKEIHTSLNHLANSNPESPLTHFDLNGFMLHEMVHIWQNSNGISSGLVEGVADGVRAALGHAPPHWSYEQDLNAEWDKGYERTGYFLLWIEHLRSPPTPNFLTNLNATLKLRPWSLDLFAQLSVDHKDLEPLWWEYQSYLGKNSVVAPPSRFDISRRLATYGVFTMQNKDSEGMLYVKDKKVMYGYPESREAALWIIGVSRDGPPYYVFFNISACEALDVDQYSYDDDASVIVYAGHGEENQQWQISQRPRLSSSPPNDPDEFKIVARHSSKAMALSENLNLIQTDYCGRDNQIWILRSA
ncbi:hypothetical protein HDU67_003441 [Dinochytrium kinnereticum]|nr:hypothetical protein HDU67_003441 [Dinochytrium kinnereticum]